jgi:PAS domain S-box-containing protein
VKLACLLAVMTLGVVGAPAMVAADPSAEASAEASAKARAEISAAAKVAVPHGLVRFRSFGSAEGLHNLVVLSITQDAAGSLWIGTDDGVARYDGERFTHFGVEQGLPSTLTQVVGVSPEGNVCVGSNAGLACWDGNRFSNTTGAGLPPIAVHAMAAAGTRLWVGTAAGLYVRGDRGPFQRAAGWPTTNPVHALWADARGVVAGDNDKIFLSSGDGAWRELSDIGLAGDRIDGVIRDRMGAVWIRSALHMWRLPLGASRAEDLTEGLPSGYDNVGTPGSMANGPHGELLVGSDVGVVMREGEHWRVIGRSAGLPSLGARTLFVDRDGSTWVGSVGLYQERGGGLLERYDLNNGLPGDVAWSMARDREGALWVGTNRCLARMLDGAWSCLPGSEKRIVRSFVFPPQGGVFLGGAPSDLLYIGPDGHVISLGNELHHPADHAILSLRIGPEGDLWVATKVGLYRLPGAVPGPLEHVSIAGIPDASRYNTLIVAEGRLWASSADGLAVNDHGTWHVLGLAAGFMSAGMRYLVHSHDHEYCVAYNEAIGVTCFEMNGWAVAKLRHIRVADGMITGSVYFLGVDRQHRLWIGTGDGVDVVTPRGIDHFGESDGIAGNDSTANAFLEDPDGSLWLGSTGGVTHLHAERYAGPPMPPRVVLRTGALGDRPIPERAQDPLETSHDLSSLKLDFGVDRLTDADRIEYQTRLAPLEPAWSATLAREGRYPSLLPGSYRFEVRARIGTGAWGPVTALAFVVHEAWWQTRWFFAGVGLAILLAIAAAFAGVYRTVLRRRTRQLNEQSTASVRALLELVPDLISVHSGGKVVYSNLAARRLYRLDAAASEHPDLGDRIHVEDRLRFAEIADARRADVTRPPEMLELRVRDDDGSWRICELTTVWMELAGATVLIASGRDVTERRQLRAQLLVSDRMASLGTLAAGIAHEINNPLAYVLGNLEVMAETIARTDQRADQRVDQIAAAIGDATDGAQRVRKIVQGLGSFTRSEEEKRVSLDLPDVLRAAIRLTANEVRHRAQLVYELGPAPRVVADDGRLTQVFINLIVNAAHAIPEGRSADNRITLRTRTDELGRAVIEIADTGRGMPPEVQARAFDPFYTTKDVGGGTGLGLSICHGIISGLGGEIAIESAPDRGTVVRVVLPAAAIPEPVAAPVAKPEPAKPAQRLRVMVVDDEPLVTEMLERVLRRDHEVVAVSCGRDALDKVNAGVWFDAIVSDVMMPNMTGLELLEALVELAPEQAKRLIFLSGGVFTQETRRRLAELGTLQLEKPINTKDLRRSVMSVASEPPPIREAVAAGAR